MSHSATPLDAMPVQGIADFDRHSGNRLERLVFNHRIAFMLACALITALLAWQLPRLVVNAGFEKIIPQGHPYIKNYLANKDRLGGLGNVIRVVVENPKGDIYDPEFLEITRQINNTVNLTPGVDRAWTRSIWMAAVRWSEVTEEGFRGGTVMPESYNGSAESMALLKHNIQLTGLRGDLVANDLRSVMIVAPLFDKDTATGQRLDYKAFSEQLEREVRAKYAGRATVHIIGFAKLVGDLIEGLYQVMLYFLASALICAAIIYAYTRCVRSTLTVLGCSVIAVVWQLGLVTALGFEIDPYSILVPFLVFAIGVSHGAQKMNGIMQDVGRGTHRYVAARYTFRRLFLAGVTALLADAVGFAVLMVIDIPVIKDLALTASIGVAVLIFTNLLLLPVVLSFVGVAPQAAARSLKSEGAELKPGSLWHWLGNFTQRGPALAAIAIAAVLLVLGYAVSLKLQTGDLEPGAAELRQDSRYNRDIAYVNAHYSLSSDQLIVMVKTPPDGCADHRVLIEAQRLEDALRAVPGVQNATSLASYVTFVNAGLSEGNPKWLTIPRNPQQSGKAVQWATADHADMIDTACSFMPVIAYLTDHKADTLKRVMAVAEAFAAQHNDEGLAFELVAGPSGIEAVTNVVVEHASRTMLYSVYGAVILLCFITFRSWRAVVVAILPLVLTSVLCEALMVALGMGVKVATLPVIALGVGIGVDYALYLLSVQLTCQRAGHSLAESYRMAIAFTGKVVALVGITLAAGVITWAFSPIKFQADMGILLTFMFLWNMVGTLILVPALSHFLLRERGPVAAHEAPGAGYSDDLVRELPTAHGAVL